MMNELLIILGSIAITGGVWYYIFYQKEKRLLNRLQKMVEDVASGKLDRTEISEEKYSALENSLKQYLDNSLLARESQQKQKEIIQSLISDIAHQTLTPISNIKIYGEILSEENKENREEIDTILEQVEKLNFLIQSLVKLSRMESGIITVHPEKISLVLLLKEVQREYEVKAKEKNVELTVCNTDFQVVCDLKWTAEAVGNIIDNAIKYTPDGGTIRVTVEKYSFFVRVDVRDNGIGMEKEEIPKIFERFYRSLSVMDQPGVGIGLYLAREIIQAQKGYMKVKSEKGKGSVFSIFLPV